MLSSGGKLSSASRSNIFPSLSSPLGRLTPLVTEMSPTVNSQPEASPHLIVFIRRGDGSHSLLVRLPVASHSKMAVIIILHLVFNVLFI